MRMTVVGAELQKAEGTDFEEATKQMCKVTRDDVVTPVEVPTMSETEMGRTAGDLSINVTCVDGLV